MKQNKITITSLFILGVTLACTIFVGGPEYPEPRIPISPEAVITLQEEIKAAVVTGAADGEITLIMTEVQLSSYLASKITEQRNTHVHRSASLLARWANANLWKNPAR